MAGVSAFQASVCSSRLPLPRAQAVRSGGRSGGLLWPGPVSFLSTQPAVEGKTPHRGTLGSTFTRVTASAWPSRVPCSALRMCWLGAGPSWEPDLLLHQRAWEPLGLALLTLGTKGALHHFLSPSLTYCSDQQAGVVNSPGSLAL